MERCGSCRKGMLRAGSSPQSRQIGDRVFSAQVEVATCDRCGEVIGLPDGRIELGLRAAAELVKAGDFSGPAMKHMRRVLSLKAEEWADILQVTRQTVSRWERGRWPVPRAVALTLGSMIIDRLEGRRDALERLSALKSPRKLASHVELGTLGRKTSVSDRVSPGNSRG